MAMPAMVTPAIFGTTLQGPWLASSDAFSMCQPVYTGSAIMRCMPTVANPGQQQFFGVNFMGPATVLAEVEDRLVLAGPASPVGPRYPAEVPTSARPWDNLPMVQASSDTQIHRPVTPACSPRMFRQNINMGCKGQVLPKGSNMFVWPPCPAMPQFPQFTPNAKEITPKQQQPPYNHQTPNNTTTTTRSTVLYPNEETSSSSSLSPSSCGSSIVGEVADNGGSTTLRTLPCAAMEVVESISPRPLQGAKSTRSLPDMREVGDDWVAQFHKHSGHFPVSAVQLQAFALNRGEQLPYSTALRMITDQHQIQDSSGSEIQDAVVTKVAATSSSCTEAPSGSACAVREFNAGHCDEDSTYMINTPTESEVGVLQLPLDGEHDSGLPGPCDATSVSNICENTNHSGPSPQQPHSPVQSRTLVHAHSPVHVQPPVLRLAEALSRQRQGNVALVASGSPNSSKVTRVAEAGSRGAEPPALGSAELPSRGSALHRWGSCKPCAFFHVEGCRNGTSCEFCHLCNAGARKRRKCERLASMRAAREEARRQQQQE